MKLKITKNIEEANLITHSSTFHPDDVFSTMFLSKIIENPIVCRTNNPDLAPRDAIVYDIGFGKFDHHGTDARIRSNSSLKYCSFGLLWEEYGKVFLEKIDSIDKEKLFKAIEEYATKRLCGYIFFTSSIKNKNAHKLYEKLGYTKDVIGFRKVLINYV